LGHSLLPRKKKHPILLYHQSGYSKLLVQEFHTNALHAVPLTMMAILSELYHMFGARRLVQYQSQHCIKCQKTYCRTTQQLMGQLPVDRARPSPPYRFRRALRHQEGQLQASGET